MNLGLYENLRRINQMQVGFFATWFKMHKCLILKLSHKSLWIFYKTLFLPQILIISWARIAGTCACIMITCIFGRPHSIWLVYRDFEFLADEFCTFEWLYCNLFFSATQQTQYISKTFNLQNIGSTSKPLFDVIQMLNKCFAFAGWWHSTNPGVKCKVGW